MSKHTDGAMRAAKAARREMRDTGEWFLTELYELATIINRETCLPELIAALLAISQAGACGDHTRDIQALEACAAIARSALAKVEGKEGTPK